MQKSRSGFTFVELLVVLAVTAILTAVGFVSLGNYRGRQAVQSAVDEVGAVVRAVRQRSLAQEEGGRWGIHFSNSSSSVSSYTTFRGYAFATGTVDRQYALPANISFSNPFVSSTYDMVFAPLSGGVPEQKVLSMVSGQPSAPVGDVVMQLTGAAVSRLESGLVGYWHLDENTSTAAYDASGRGNAGTLTGSVSWTTGKSGNAVNCGNTTSDYVNISATVDLSSEWTIESWFQYPLTSTGASWWTLTRGNAGDHQIIVRRSDSLLGMYDDVGGTGFNSTGYAITSLSSGWHHIAAVGSGGVQNFYTDGSYVGQSARQSTTDVSAICNYQGGSQNWGVVDEVRIYNRALSAAEILSHYNDLK